MAMKRRKTIKDVRAAANIEDGGSGLPEVFPMPKLEVRDRITVINTFNYEHRGDQPYSTQNIFVRKVEKEHEPYSRRVTVKEAWTKLDLGWVPPEDVGAVIIDNLEGVVLGPTQPDMEEREEMAKRILEVSYTKNSKEADLVYPKGSLQKFPASASSIYLRCQSGTASYRVHVFPK